MAISAEMVNPTPYDVKIPFKAGVDIKIPADGAVGLSMEQLDDFRPGKPGSEETRKLLNFEGVFLNDTDLSYDFQALRALEAFVREKKDRFKNFVERTRNSRIAGGVAVDDDTMEDLVLSSGYGKMRKQIEAIEVRIKTLKTVVKEDEDKGSVRQTLDPLRTCAVINPPREFPSVTALNMFLNEHPDIKARHDELSGTAAIKAEEDLLPVSDSTSRNTFPSTLDLGSGE